MPSTLQPAKKGRRPSDCLHAFGRQAPNDDAAARIREFATWKVFAPTADDVLAAIALRKHARLNFWDAMVVQAAAASKCDLLWTEDLNEGQVLRGVRIRNPFAAKTSTHHVDRTA